MAKKSDGYIASTRKEFKKITWPNKKEVLEGTLLVIVFSVLIGLIIRGLDLVYSYLLGLILS